MYWFTVGLIIGCILSFQSIGFGSLTPESVVRTTTVDLDNKELNQEQLNECFRLAEDRDLLDFGLIPEFVGRFPRVCPFHCLDENMLVQVLTEPKNALLKQYKHLFALNKVRY